MHEKEKQINLLKKANKKAEIRCNRISQLEKEIKKDGKIDDNKQKRIYILQTEVEKNLGKIERLETTLDKIRKQKDYFEARAKKLGQEVEEYQAK